LVNIPTARESFIELIEDKAIEAAQGIGFAIRIERDSRGRYPTLIIRVVGEVDAEPHVVARKVDGVLVKEGK
jgi:hypothetical protein